MKLLPLVWMSVPNQGLRASALRFLDLATQREFGESAYEFLAFYADGLTRDVPVAFYESWLPSDDHRALRSGMITAAAKLHNSFNGLVPVWASLAPLFPALREDPFARQSIQDEQLPTPWGPVTGMEMDAFLHTGGMVYDWAHMRDALFAQYAGVRLRHGCNCDCHVAQIRSAPEMPELSPEEIEHTAIAFLQQACSEWAKFHVLGLPHALATPTVATILAAA